ncbi:hypothetical protein Micbo1qcDRAFT_23791 [Microdochium bolleyi]|uniref:Uncharacterized protein n=1 Tax=Microdochium bolleyi TaxID=196109 RepID=A0A136JD05_9PEZI|nr:hypothetical protein Micbo1qcDRAFT_23791 [Microdochium bolleyi]
MAKKDIHPPHLACRKPHEYTHTHTHTRAQRGTHSPATPDFPGRAPAFPQGHEGRCLHCLKTKMATEHGLEPERTKMYKKRSGGYSYCPTSFYAKTIFKESKPSQPDRLRHMPPVQRSHCTQMESLFCVCMLPCYIGEML